MICPKCGSDTMNKEKGMVICSNCGFGAPLQEYNVWKKVHEVKPRRKEKTVLHEGEETDQEVDGSIEDLFNNKNFRVFIFILILAVIILAILSM